jgi:c-di-GMP-related signal transduction protein
MEIYVARQPIFDRNLKIHGYELLFRGGMTNAFPDIDGNTATSKLLSNTFLSMGLDQVSGGKKAFINFTQDLLIKKVPSMFPREKIMVEVLEDVQPGVEVLEACLDMSKKGYELALDDFLYREELKPLVELAKIVKIDFMASSIDEIAEYVERLTPFGVKFLAEKVETHEDVENAIGMGFSYFQGYFFSKPQIVKGTDVSPSKMTLMQMVAEANKEAMKFEELEKIVSRDVSISYKLLRYMNSAYFKRLQEISSIKQAMVLLGQEGLRRFISLILMAQLASDKPEELLRTSIIRARLCELLGKEETVSSHDSELFTLGLFSLIDAILDEDMEKLMEELPLSEGIKRALISGEGKLSDFLNLIRAYETGDWTVFSETSCGLGIREEKFPEYYMDAVGWADSMTVL